MPGNNGQAKTAEGLSSGQEGKVAALRQQTQKTLQDIEGLVARPASRDAGASHQRNEQPQGSSMTQTPHGNNGGKAAGPSDTVFIKPAPEGAAKKISEVLGEIVWLMSQSPLHKQLFISDLEWLVMTPIMLQQFRLFYDKEKPIGVAFWASVSAEVEERLAAGTSRLRPQDWKSGDSLWVVEIIAPFGGAEEMVKDLKAKVFANRELKFLTVSEKGKEVKVL